MKEELGTKSLMPLSLLKIRVVLSGEPASQHLLTLSRHDTIREVRNLILRSATSLIYI